MSTPTFADTHNLVAFLEKPAESIGFKQIIDFLKSKPIHYALTVNLTIYVSCVKQFWATAKVKRVNDQEQIQALVDKQKVIITKDSIRSDLCFDDAESTTCLLNEEFFEGLARMGYEKPSQKLTFYKAYFYLQWKFLIHTILQCLSAKTTAWNEFSSTMASFIICLADNQKFNFSKYIFDNIMKSLEGGIKFYMFPRFLQIFLDNQVEGMARHKEIPQKKQQPRRKHRKVARVSHDESKDEDHVPTPSSDPLPSGEDSYTLNELMVFFTSLQKHVIDLQEAKDAQSKEIAALKKKVDPLPSGEDSYTLNELMVFFTSLQEHVIDLQEAKDAQSKEIAALKKKGRMIEEIDQDDEIALDVDTQGRKNDDEMFRINDLSKKEVVLDTRTGEHKEHIIEDVSTAELVTTAGKVVTTIADKVSAAPTIDITEDDITMAQALAALKCIKPKVVDKGKAKMIEPKVPIKKKDQMRMDEDLLAKRLQAREWEEFSEVDENVEPVIDDTKELKKYMEIVPDDEYEVLIEATPISSRSPTILDYKIHKEGKKNYFKIIRADGNSQVYQTFEKMFKNFNREDVEVLWAVVKDRFKKEKPVDDMDNILFRTLKTMFEHHVEDNIWT
nr:hypothetical protein [Tanacetum cinerariifolium]